MQQKNVFNMNTVKDAVKESEHVVSMTQHVQGMDKHQDQTYLGRGVYEPTGEKFDFALVTDGHGRDDVIRILRQISATNLLTMLEKEDPVDVLAKYVKRKQDELFALNRYNHEYAGTGATMCLVRIFSNRIECINAGDSQAYVYCDGSLLFKTEEHTAYSEREVDRLKAMNPEIYFVDSFNIAVVSETRMVQSVSKYAVWPDGHRLACTQALGHGWRTGYAPDVNTIMIEPGRSYQVIVGSDGIWDMLIKDSIADAEQLWGLDAEGVVKFANDRWLQEWEMTTLADPDTIHKCSYSRHHCDDMGAAVVKITPNT
jgi:serine/threonine protein phosphatase PrpC